MSKIIQITPANAGWFVAYEFENGQTCKLPVACWALCETTEDGAETRWVRPITVDGQASALEEGDDDAPGCISMGKFIGIIAPGETEPCETVIRHLTLNKEISGERNEGVMDYQIATGYGPSELVLKVNELIDLGWTPAGGIAVEPASGGYVAVYSQTMTSTKESREAAAHARDY